jgi:uncharacterized protein with ATP-grasp and redox domains
MKATQECHQCLAQLVRQAAEFATDEPGLRATAIEEGLRLLDREFSLDRTSIAVATPLHRLVRKVTGNHDPYIRMKQAEVAMARELRRDWENEPIGDLRACLVLAVRGNNIDFFEDLDAIKKDLPMPVQFATDDIARFEEQLETTQSMLYLADNAGEVFFDLPLVRRLSEVATVTFVVKESPVQNDVTLADLRGYGLESELTRVITTGTDTPGVDMDMASAEFRSEFEASDLVLAKGMGYWETLSELPSRDKVFHLLKAKCRPVADSLGVALGSYVARLR